MDDVWLLVVSILVFPVSHGVERSKGLRGEIVHEGGRSAVVGEDVVVDRELVFREKQVHSRLPFVLLDRNWDLAPVQRLLVEAEREVLRNIALEVAPFVLVCLELVWFDYIVLVQDKDVALAQKLAYLSPAFTSGSPLRVAGQDGDVLVVIRAQVVVATESNPVRMLEAKTVSKENAYGRVHKVIVHLLRALFKGVVRVPSNVVDLASFLLEYLLGLSLVDCNLDVVIVQRIERLTLRQEWADAEHDVHGLVARLEVYLSAPTLL